MESLGPIIDSTANSSGSTPETLADIERIRAVLAVVGKRLAATDTVLILPSTLDGIAEEFAQAKAQLDEFLSDNNAARLAQANVHCDTVIQLGAQLLVLAKAVEITSLNEAAVSYRTGLARSHQDATTEFETFRSTIHSTQAALLREFEDAKAHLEDLSTNIQIERDRVARAQLEQQEQFSNAEATRSADFSNSLQGAINQHHTLTTDHISQFSTAQDNRGKEFTDAQTKRQVRFQDMVDSHSEALRAQEAESTKQRGAIIKTHEEELNRLSREYQKNAEEILVRIQEQKRGVEELVGVIGNLGVTSGYLKTANSARKSLWLWQAVAVVAMAGLIIVAIWIFYPTITGQDGGLSWPSFAGRVFITFTFGALAAYAAKQADNFFEVERRNRKLALELEAIGPYLAPLPPAQQHEFRIRMGDKSFGQDQAFSVNQTRSPATAADVLLSLLKLVKSKDFEQLVEGLNKIKG